MRDEKLFVAFVRQPFLVVQALRDKERLAALHDDAFTHRTFDNVARFDGYRLNPVRNSNRSRGGVRCRVEEAQGRVAQTNAEDHRRRADPPMERSLMHIPVVGRDDGPCWCGQGGEEGKSKECRFTGAPHARRVNLLSRVYSYLTKMQKSVKIGSSMRARKSGNGRPASTEKKRKIKHLSVDEVRRLFRVIPAKKIRDRLLFDLIYHYGLRRTEACLLQVEDFNPRKNTIVVHRLKGSDSHPYPLFPSTRRLIVQYLAQYRAQSRDPEDHTWTRSLFPSRQRVGKPISASLVAHLFREYAKSAKIPSDRQNVHSLRHSIAMHMGEGEIDGVDMQDWMAHVSWASTRIYMHVSERRRLKTLKKMLASGEIA